MPRATSANPRGPLSAALILNLLLPGTGLILRRREWLGLALSLLFGICCNVALAGRLIAPAAIPGWLTMLAIVMAAATWLWGQVLFKRCGVSASTQSEPRAASPTPAEQSASGETSA